MKKYVDEENGPKFVGISVQVPPMWYTEKSSAVNNSLQTAKLDSQKTIVY